VKNWKKSSTSFKAAILVKEASSMKKWTLSLVISVLLLDKDSRGHSPLPFLIQKNEEVLHEKTTVTDRIGNDYTSSDLSRNSLCPG
jgi:hypothetical protein